MTPAHTLLESVVRPAPIGLRFRDVATGLPVRDGLSVTVTPTRRPARRIVLDRNGSGVWFAHRFPGINDEQLGTTEDWTSLAQPCRIEVADALGRFLPLVLDMDLPVRGLADWPNWGSLPQPPLAPLTETDTGVSPPASAVSPDALPLFSAPGRMAPAPLAEVRAQLAFRDTGAPAAWSLLTVAHGGRVRGIGQADDKGSVVVWFPYPERPRPSLATSPPAVTDFRWSLDMVAYSKALPADVLPEFGVVMDQLTRPRDLFASTTSPPELLPSQLMSFGRPLTLRTAETADGPTSLLMMQPA